MDPASPFRTRPTIGRRPAERSRAGTPAAVLLLVLSLLAGLPAAAQDPPAAVDPPSPELLQAFRDEPLRFFFELRTNDAIACSQVLLSDPGLDAESRKRMLTALTAIHVAGGRTLQARAACLALLADDPRVDLDRPAILPPPVKRLFYGIRDSLLLEMELELPPDIRTVAVGEITASQLVPGRYDLGRFARGLGHVLVTDLEGATPLRIVDRQRLDVLVREIGMSQNEDILDPAYAVPFGKLSGAQSFLFGSLLQVEEDRIRFDLRWVDTSTSEILLSEGVEAKVKSSGDLFDLEKKVLLELIVPRMYEILAEASPEGSKPKKKDLERDAKRYLEEKKRAKMAENASYLDLLLATGDALLAEERGDLAAARAAWSEVDAMRPGDPVAEDRALALAAFVDLAEEEQVR